MWSKEKPQDPEAERFDVNAVAFENGKIYVWDSRGGCSSIAAKITYDPSVSTPYLVRHDEWRYDVTRTGFDPVFGNSSPLGIFCVLKELLFRKYWYYLDRKYELVVRDPAQLREYSLVGVRQGIPAPIVAGL